MLFNINVLRFYFYFSCLNDYDCVLIDKKKEKKYTNSLYFILYSYTLYEMPNIYSLLSLLALLEAFNVIY